MDRREKRASKGQAPTLRGYHHPPRVLSTSEVRKTSQLTCFCLLCLALLFFLSEALSETVGLSDKLENVTLAGQAGLIFWLR